MNVREALNAAASRIARRDAEVLLAHLLERETAWLLGHATDPIPTEIGDALERLADRRAAHEPLQYLTGRQEFFGMMLRVTPDTLIPRPETELLVETVLGWASTQPGRLRLVDVGTGTGAIALALAAHLPQAEVFACDLSRAALDVARANAAQHGLSERVRWLQADLFEHTDFDAARPFDAVVSNPPYIPTGDAATLQAEVRDFEPAAALFAGQDGMDIYRRLVPLARNRLRPHGLLAMEMGFGQRGAMQELLAEWEEVRFVDDYAGIPRVALAVRA